MSSDDRMGGGPDDGIDREFEPVADDEREVDLDEDGPPAPPPTLDPEERIEDDRDDREPLPDDERPV
jgi:hypothetical protein